MSKYFKYFVLNERLFRKDIKSIFLSRISYLYWMKIRAFSFVEFSMYPNKNAIYVIGSVASQWYYYGFVQESDAFPNNKAIITSLLLESIDITSY